MCVHCVHVQVICRLKVTDNCWCVRNSTDFPDCLPVLLSISVFLLFSFSLFPLFSCWFHAVQVKLTYTSFRLHVKIASCIVKIASRWHCVARLTAWRSRRRGVGVPTHWCATLASFSFTHQVTVTLVDTLRHSAVTSADNAHDLSLWAHCLQFAVWWDTAVISVGFSVFLAGFFTVHEFSRVHLFTENIRCIRFYLCFLLFTVICFFLVIKDMGLENSTLLTRQWEGVWWWVNFCETIGRDCLQNKGQLTGFQGCFKGYCRGQTLN